MASWKESLASAGVACFESPGQARAAAEVLGRTTTAEVLQPRPTGSGWSLSDTYGYTAFPWHTDAAVATRAPRWIVLSAVEITEATQTEVVLPPQGTVAKMRRSPLQVRGKNGRVRYLPAAVPEAYGHRLRWDPRVATPRASELLLEVEALTPTVTVRWRSGVSAIVDNHRTLHRRPAVGAEANRILTRYYIWTD